MQHVGRPAVAGMVAAAVVLVAGCSGPTASEAPVPPSGSATPAVAASSDAPTAEAPASGSPTAAPTASSSPSASEPEVEPSRPVETAPPKKLDESTRTAGAEVSLASVRTTTVKATAPGDRSGPGVLVRLTLVNASGRTLDTSFTQVGLTDRTGTAATLVDGSPTDALPPSVRAGRKVQGTYAFLVDDVSAGPVTVSVSVTSGQPVVTFRGRAS